MTDSGEHVLDRQQRLKATHRAAIARAAAELSQEFGPGGFSTNQLAERADVSRRTIFNHFPSTDAAIYAGLSQVLDGAFDEIIAAFARHRPDDHDEASHERDDDQLAAVFSALSSALLEVDLLAPMSRLAKTIPALDTGDEGVNLWAGGVLRSITPRLTAAIESRAPGICATTSLLLVQCALVAVAVTTHHWATAAATDDHAGRRLWHDTLASNLARLGAGFARPALPPPADPT